MSARKDPTLRPQLIIDTGYIEVITVDGQRVKVALRQLAEAHHELERRAPLPLVDEIQMVCAGHFGLRPSELRSSRRQPHLVYVRHIAMYLAREVTEYSFPQIGRCFGGRDHTAVLYAVEKVEQLCATDESAKADVEYLEAVLVARLVAHREKAAVA